MRKHHSPAFKAQVVRELLKEENSISQLAAEYDVRPNQLYRWREVALTGLPRLFSGQSAQEQAAKDAAHAQQLEELYAEIGKLTTQLSWIKKSCHNEPRRPPRTGGAPAPRPAAGDPSGVTRAQPLPPLLRARAALCRG